MPTHATWSRAELAYCSNVHPGETLDAVLANLAGPIRAVRERRGLARMASGLWLSAAAAAEAAAGGRARKRLAQALERAGIDLITLNSFPYGGFHAARVKQAVYHPDWSEPARLAYTLQCAALLDALLPDGSHTGSVSTLPLGDAAGWSAEREAASAEALCRLALGLAELEARGGRTLRVCLEPEPGCAIESTDQALAFFDTALPAAARRTGTAPDLVERHLGICIDICHQAVMFEDVAVSLARLRAAGVEVGKLQLSSALEVHAPSNPATRQALLAFAEPRYLHQVRAPGARDALLAAADLDLAMSDPLLATSTPWRVHYHVPLQAERLAHDRLATTRHAVERALAWLATCPDCRPHLEVETYTWGVLPEGQRPVDADALTDGIAAELHWVEQAMARRGLLADGRA